MNALSQICPQEVLVALAFAAVERAVETHRTVRRCGSGGQRLIGLSDQLLRVRAVRSRFAVRRLDAARCGGPLWRNPCHRCKQVVGNHRGVAVAARASAYTRDLLEVSSRNRYAVSTRTRDAVSTRIRPETTRFDCQLTTNWRRTYHSRHRQFVVRQTLLTTSGIRVVHLDVDHSNSVAF